MEDALKVFRLRLLDIFYESGIVIDSQTIEEDFDLREYVEDSIQFISSIVEIENQLGIELHDDLLVFDNFASFYAFSLSIWEICQENR